MAYNAESFSAPQDLSEIDLTKALMCLFKGDPGMRKSTAAASFPEPYFLDGDGKVGAVQKVFPNKKIMFNRIRNLDEHLNILERLAKSCPYQTVIDDSVTATSSQIFAAANFYRSGGEGNVEGSGKRILKGKVEMPQIEDYKMELRTFDMIMDLLKAINSQGVHVILTAHVITTNHEDIKTKVKTTKQSLMTGAQKSAALLPSLFTEAYHFYCEDGYAGKKSFKAATVSIEDNWAMTALNLPADIDWTDRPFFKVLMESISVKA